MLAPRLSQVTKVRQNTPELVPHQLMRAERREEHGALRYAIWRTKQIIWRIVCSSFDAWFCLVGGRCERDPLWQGDIVVDSNTGSARVTRRIDQIDFHILYIQSTRTTVNKRFKAKHHEICKARQQQTIQSRTLTRDFSETGCSTRYSNQDGDKTFIVIQDGVEMSSITGTTSNGDTNAS